MSDPEQQTLTDENTQRIAALNQKGISINLDAIYVSSLIEWMIGQMFGEETPKLVRDGFHQIRLAAILDDMEKQVDDMIRQQQAMMNRARILGNGQQPMPPGFPMAGPPPQ